MAGFNKQWITSKQAAEILTKNSGHPVSRQYVRNLSLMGQLTARQIDGRTQLYNRHQVEAYRVVKGKPGRRPTRKKRQEEQEGKEQEQQAATAS